LIIINGKTYCQVYVQGSGGYSVTGNATVNDNQPHLLGCVWDGSALHVYGDASEDQSPTATAGGSLRNGTSHLYIGEGASNTEQFTGKIDEAVLANSTLPTSTISALYNSGNGKEICIANGCGKF
jgi:hypothetical protein